MHPSGHNSQPPLPPPTSIHSALQMDPNQQMQLQQPPPQGMLPPPPSQGKKRKKGDGAGDEGSAPSEPRRLRRSHEACARCRSKKIKASPVGRHRRQLPHLDNSHILNLSTEDRHRQTLTPRGHTERIELQLAQCEALLKLRIPDFELDKLEEILTREGIDVTTLSPHAPTPAFQFEPQPTTSRPFRTDSSAQPPNGPLKGYMPIYPPPPQPMLPHPPYPHMIPYGAPGPYQLPMQGPPPGHYPPIHHPFQQPPPGAPYTVPPPPPPPQHQPAHHQPQPQPPPPATASPVTRPIPTKGTDPNGNDLSNTEALAKNFGVSSSITSEISLGHGPVDKEDLAVGSSGLTSGRDRDSHESSMPKDRSKWLTVTVRRNSNAGAPPNTLSLSGPTSNAPSVEVWLPKDRSMAKNVVDVYFRRLNIHRPVYFQKDFEKLFDDLYDGKAVAHDPGYICSAYLILALGTLSELNHRATTSDVDNKADVHLGPEMAKKLMPRDWPQHDEFFERALAVKPDLRVTLSSLQALILLHWYLYTERQGRTLWRLVGSLVRLSIELGLHHDPTTQMIPNTNQPLFTEDERELRIRLWGIVLVHDRGTSILLGRPLAISPSDSSTPLPTRPQDLSKADFSEHFELSHPVADIQADIINSLYTPKRQNGDTIMRHATRIIKRMVDFRGRMPEKYKYYFNGTTDWTLDQKSKLVQEITEDEGLTLLKIGIARILLLRALFSSKELSYANRHKALIDAIITSHNTIVIHNQMIRFPDIAFFTSPIPLHIAAMVILYGHMSNCDKLPRNTALEDIWLALDMLPRFRWRWERKDVNGGHPLIAKLAERVMDVSLHQIGPVHHPHLLCEPDWDEDTIVSPIPKSQQTTPTLSTASFANSASTHGQRSMQSNNGSSSAGSTTPDKQLVDIPTTLFYPFYPESGVPVQAQNGQTNGSGSSGHQDYAQILAAAAAQGNTFGMQPSQDSYVSEERDVPHPAHFQMWMNMGQRTTQNYTSQPQS
ncbi:hypothetical protein AX16_001933 [Volvariella volvacea WC 439]|nr:hypothetical protein AX16_001933 [Volvariella volvacea WC 439]